MHIFFDLEISENNQISGCFNLLQQQTCFCMNILNLEVRLKRVKIKTNNNEGVSFSLRLGRVLSVVSASIPNRPDSPIQPNIDLIIACDQSMINSSSRASLALYEAKQNEHPQIIGMVFIMLKAAQGQVKRYKVQQSNDINSFVQLAFMITSLQLKENQNKSLASKSSLAEIRQLHRVLSRENKKNTGDLSDEQRYVKKSRLSPQDKQRQLRSRNNNKILHLKSQQSPYGDEDPSYAILLRKAEMQLAKQKQRSSLLTNLLVIQEQKNNQSENFIKQMLIHYENIKNNQKTELQSSKPSFSEQNLLQQTPRQSSSGQKSKIFKAEEKCPQEQEKIQNLIKQRDQLYNISQQLYEKTKKYKIQNQKMFKNIKALQNQMKLYESQIEQLKTENLQLKSKFFQICDQKNKNELVQQKGQTNSLIEQNQKLRNQNTQYQRKFKESYRAIEEFKNIAWRAQEEVIIKEQQITTLKEELEQIKNGSMNKQSRQFSSDSHTFDNKEAMKHTLQTFKLMSALLMKNNLQRNQVIRLLSSSSSQEVREQVQKKIQISKLITKMKELIGNVYEQYERENKKSVQILEMRKKIFEAINQLNF